MSNALLLVLIQLFESQNQNVVLMIHVPLKEHFNLFLKIEL